MKKTIDQDKWVIDNQDLQRAGLETGQSEETAEANAKASRIIIDEHIKSPPPSPSMKPKPMMIESLKGL